LQRLAVQGAYRSLMARTPKQKKNLRRGRPIQGNAETARRGGRAKQEQRREAEELRVLTSRNPREAMLVTLRKLASAVLRQLASWQAMGGDPPANLIDSVKVCRKYCEHLIEVDDELADEAEQQAFIDRLGAAVQHIYDQIRAGIEKPTLPAGFGDRGVVEDDESPAAILRQLYDRLTPAIARAADRLGKGALATRRSNLAMDEFRMLSETIRRLDTGALKGDDGMDLLLADLPERMVEVEKRLAEVWVPPTSPHEEPRRFDWDDFLQGFGEDQRAIAVEDIIDDEFGDIDEVR
jgi:hypothetical protein